MRKWKLVKALACFTAATTAMSGIGSINLCKGGIVREAKAAEVTKITNSTTMPVTIPGGNFWQNFSDNYTVSGDFDVTFEIQLPDIEPQENWHTPIIAFTTNADRYTGNYKEYAVIRSDAYGWSTAGNNKTIDGTDIQYNASWIPENDTESAEETWAGFRKLMRNARITSNIIRRDNNFVIYNIIHGGDGKDYTYEVNFSVAAEETINLFWITDTNEMTIQSYSDNILVNPEVTYENGAYVVFYHNYAVTEKENGGYSIDLTKIFDNKLLIDETIDVEESDVVEIALNYGNDCIRNVKLKFIAPNRCQDFTLEQDDLKTLLYDPVSLVTQLQGEKEGYVIEDPDIMIIDAEYDDKTAVLPEKMRLFFTVEHSYLEMKQVIDNKTNTVTEINSIVGNEDRSTPFLGDVSDYYTLDSDSDVTFEFVNHSDGVTNWNNYLAVFTSDADRGTENYTEYEVLRADAYGWYDTPPSETRQQVNYQYDWDWQDFSNIMKDANVSMNIKRHGDFFVVTAKVTPVGEEKTYTYTTHFNYLSNYTYFIANIKRDSFDRNRVTSEIVGQKAGKYKALVLCGNTKPKEITLEFIENKCEKIEGALQPQRLAAGQYGVITVTASGVRKDVRLTDWIDIKSAVQGGWQSLNYTNQNGEITARYQFRSDIVTSSSITICCGLEKLEIPYTAEENLCESLESSSAAQQLGVGQEGIITITAAGKDKDIELSDNIELISAGTMENNGYCRLNSYKRENGKITAEYRICSNIETSSILSFRCGSKTLEIPYTAESNPCESWEGFSYPKELTVGKEGEIGVVLTGKNKELPVTDNIELLSIGAIEGHGYCKFDYFITDYEGETVYRYRIRSDIATSSAITLRCGSKILEIPYTIKEAEQVKPVTTPASITATTAEPKVVDGGEGFWTDFSDNYVLTGDFDVTLELQTSDEVIAYPWLTPYYVFSSAAEIRLGEGYKEYFLARSDEWGWSIDGGNNCTWEGNKVIYEYDWSSLSEFKKIMRNANITSHITRKGDDFEINNVIHASNGKDYHYQVKFTTKADEKIHLFLTTEYTSLTINSFLNLADFVNNSKLSEGVTFKDDVYEIDSKASYVTAKDGKYEVDLSKIFVPETAGTKTVDANTVTTVEITVNGVKKSFDIKILADNNSNEDNSGSDNPEDNTGGNTGGTTGGNTGGTTGGNTGSSTGTTTGGNTNGTTTGNNTGTVTEPQETTPPSQTDTKTETKTETKEDGTKVETVTETKTDGSTTETVKETKTDGSTTETVKETKTDGTILETAKEIKANGSTTETVKETKADGSSTETKKVTAGDNSATLQTVVETDAAGNTNANAVISTGTSKTGTVEISKELLESVAETGTINSLVVEISETTITSTAPKKANTVINVSIPSVDGVSVDKVVLTGDSIKAAKDTKKGLKVNVTNGDENSADSYTVTIPAKQLAKIADSVESLNIAINTDNVGNVTAQKKELTEAVTKSKGKQKKTCVVSIAENESIGNVGLKVTIPVKGKADIAEGSKVYVYKYNEKTGKLEEIANCKQTVSADGTVAIAAASGTDYVVSAKKLSGKNVETIKDNINVALAKNSVKAGKTVNIKVSLPDTVSTKTKFGTEKATITYKSGDSKIASVSAKGVVTTKQKGTVTITTVIKLESGQKVSEKQKITVK